MKVTIGTRGSLLALAQTSLIKEQLIAVDSRFAIETIVITTTGDKNLNPVPLDTVGKGWFTKELDKALLTNKIDLAVHSLKDLPEILPEGLIIAGIPEREDPRDVLITKNGQQLEDVKNGGVIGTDSIRRKIQLFRKRPDVIVKSLRGNVDSRLTKLEKGEYDGIILAAAGLKRLGLQQKITQYFDATDIIPSPGQGALAIVTKKDNKELVRLIEKLNHEPTVIIAQAERAFSAAIGGGCKTPTGAYALCEGNTITLYGMIGSLDGKYIAKESIEGPATENIALGKKLAERLLDVSKNW